jgi:hypothetical protein
MKIHYRQACDSPSSDFYYLTWDKMLVIEVVWVPCGAAEMDD